MIAAAWAGEMTSAIMGTAMPPMPLPKPPFEIPVRMIAGMAAT